MPEKSLNWYLKTLTLKNEFTSYNWKFSHVPSELFYFSQWPIHSTIFLIYRCALSVYTFYGFVQSVAGFPDPMLPVRPWGVFLTNWAYFILMLHCLCSFVTVLRHHLKVAKKVETNMEVIIKLKEKSSSQVWSNQVPKLVKLNWFLFALAAPTALLVTIVYFKALYPLKKINYIPIGDFHMHLMNSIIILMEVSINAIPVRLQHVIYPMILGGMYSVFSYIYWSLDPPNNVIYRGVVDWAYPLRAFLTCLFLACALLPLLHLFLYILFRFRLFIFQACHIDRQLVIISYADGDVRND
ncbi:hypothetical protein HELRODRAFT_159832 [Helobdella robusta]|uniref:Protein rolling stone n=1 Tax=Helobdella robusta TaxID=6412 RepID=T1EPG4_HELRO|nr:hypothetical protein HELRODRAFT_159832 [Helobdella robusta]ESO13199.1 hypothetical protein HELRODRAFT_159832 [Helobdella robusta]